MKTSLIALSFTLSLACGGDPQNIDLRPAFPEECPNGGVVLADEKGFYPVCDGDGQGPAGPTGATGSRGVDGKNGADGAPGRQGAQGPSGPPGSSGSNNIIVGTTLCQAVVGSTFVEAYIWRIDADADSNDDIGICLVSEGLWNRTEPFIGSACSLFTPTRDLFTVILGPGNTATLSGSLVGGMACQ